MDRAFKDLDTVYATNCDVIPRFVPWLGIGLAGYGLFAPVSSQIARRRIVYTGCAFATSSCVASVYLYFDCTHDRRRRADAILDNMKM